ncbi:spore coat protein JA [Thermoactinomyces sp. DSM 45892]|nr:spore coat protein JA [Thermoactinomyces sp. DSM 45892]
MNQKDHCHHTSMKTYSVYHGPFDPCPPIGHKYYSTPPHLYMGFQPRCLEQFPIREALFRGTLWRALYDPYENPYKKGGGLR